MLEKLSSSDWTPAHAAHLFARAGFGATPKMVRALHGYGLETAVESLLAGRDDEASFPAPAWTSDPRPVQAVLQEKEGRPDDEKGRQELRARANREDRRRMQELRREWLRRMRYGSHPLREKMTLFWHGHFATSNAKVQHPYSMWKQNGFLRGNALGNVRDLFAGISRDPAMMRWLDLTRSSRKQPNENFGREFLELFSLGEGHYTEADVKAAARAFTGYRISLKTGGFIFSKKAHDPETKRFMGHSGSFDGDGIIDLVLADPQCARFLSGRILEYMVCTEPAEAEIEAAGRTLQENRYEIRPLLRSIFLSKSFYSEKAMRGGIKSPVQWLVQAAIGLETDVPPQPMLDGALSQLGQLPFEPPNVRGWEGGRSWISSSTLVLRYNLAAYFSGQMPLPNGREDPKHWNAIDPDRLVPKPLRGDREKTAAALVDRLFGPASVPRMEERALEAVKEVGLPVSDVEICRALNLLMCTPDYQLA